MKIINNNSHYKLQTVWLGSINQFYLNFHEKLSLALIQKLFSQY